MVICWPLVGDLDGLAGVGELQVADVHGVQCPGLGAAVLPLADEAAGRICR